MVSKEMKKHVAISLSLYQTEDESLGMSPREERLGVEDGTSQQSEGGTVEQMENLKV